MTIASTNPYQIFLRPLIELKGEDTLNNWKSSIRDHLEWFDLCEYPGVQPPDAANSDKTKAYRQELIRIRILMTDATT
jgi:hypothetical protein